MGLHRSVAQPGFAGPSLSCQAEKRRQLLWRLPDYTQSGSGWHV